MSLYRKYRPQSFGEVIGQDHVVTTLTNALAKDKVAHAYLFAGPRGTAKTTTARILARELGCGDLDIIEIDAASHRGIDEVRALREQVQFQPTSGDKKIYILDEVHMLTKEAFNALLKILEEPPHFAHFVMCTTEPHKVPVTIISRTQRFDFRPGSPEDLKILIKRVADAEGISLPGEVMDIIATHATGGYRDALSILEQVIHSDEGNITEDRVRSVIGIVDEVAIEGLLATILEKNTNEALAQIARLEEQQVQWPYVLSMLLRKLRHMLRDLVTKTSDTPTELIFLIQLLIQASRDVRHAPVASLPLEMAVVEWGVKDTRPDMAPEQMPQKQTNVTRPVKNKEEPSKLQAVESEPVAVSQDAEPRQSTNISDVAEIVHLWPEVLRAIKPYNHTLEALLKGCQPGTLEEGVLTLYFKYKFHKEKIEVVSNRRIVEEVIQKVAGTPLKVSCVLVENHGTSRVAFHGNDSIPAIDDPPPMAQKSSGHTTSNPGTMRRAKANDTIALAMEEFGGKVIEEKRE